MKTKILHKNINVLIPDGDTLLTLSVIKCLSNIKNVNIHILSSRKWYETRFSRHVKSFNYFKSNSEDDLISQINQLSIKKNIKVILPVNVPMIKLIAKNLKFLNHDVLIPSVENLNIANNKWNLAIFLNNANIQLPKTYDLDIVKNVRKLDFPLIIKPKQGWNGCDIFKVDDFEKYQTVINKIGSKKNYILQNYIQGYDIDMSVLCNNGKIQAFTIQKECLKNPRLYCPPLGVEFLFKKDLFDLVEKLIKRLNWSGVAHIDLRYDQVKKQYVIIEINPRFWGSVEASNKVGINFPYLYCLSSIGAHFDIPEYQFESYVNNRGMFKILISKLNLKRNKIKVPKHHPFISDLLDPLPKTYKYLNKILKKF